jgi:hypothetical protein
VLYKINKGSNRGGNHANVNWSDYGVVPTKRLSTGDNGIQDNRFHYLGGYYSRGYGDTGIVFVFDKSLAADPSCSISNPIR